MSQHDYNIANGGGAAVRADINNALLAILSQNSGATAPTVTKPFMTWYDTTTGVLKMRNAADSAWISAMDAISGGNPQGFKNRIINGGAQIGQRGNVVFSSTNNLYGWCDRWLMSISGTTVSALGYQASGQPTKTGYAVQFGNVTTTGATTVTVQQRIESANCFDLNGNSVTFSGQVKQTSGSTQTLTLNINKANALDNFGGITQIATTTVSVPNNTWTPFTFTVTLGASDASNGLSVSMAYGSLGAQSSSQFYYGDLQLEKGSTATSFDYRPYGTELALCQRYYQQVSFAVDGQVVATGFNSTSAVGLYSFPTQMRAAPTVAFVGTVTANLPGIGVITFTSPSGTGYTKQAGLSFSGGSVLSAGYPAQINGGTATFNSEL